MIERVCENCDRTFLIPPSRAKTARACCRYCLGAIQSKERKGVFGMGPNNPMFKNGIMCYRRWAYAVYGKKCQDCGTVEGWIEVHHINADRTDNRIENLAVLCRSCHFKRHGMHKNFKTTTDS